MQVIRVSRGWQLGVGIIALLFGLPCVALGVFAAWAIRTPVRDDRTSAIVVAAIFLGLGLPMLIAGLRLSFAKPRQDAGLFAPFFLRAAGIVVIALPVVFFAAGKVVDGVIALTHVGAAFALFALAAHRQRHL